MAKKLKKWNGTAIYNRKQVHVNIAAYSQKQAREILSSAGGFGYVQSNLISDYFSDCWGNSMDGIEPTEPSIWVEITRDQPTRLSNKKIKHN